MPCVYCIRAIRATFEIGLNNSKYPAKPYNYNHFLSTRQDVVMLNGFGTVINAFGARTKPYLPQICGTILWRLNNKNAKVRQQAADLIARISFVMKTCGEVSRFLSTFVKEKKLL